MAKYKAIISDIDGTLTLLSHRPKLSNKVIKTINQLKKHGVIFTLATGKPYSLVQHLIDDLRLESPIIVDNGAAIYNSATKQPIWQSVMTYEQVNTILAIVKDYKGKIWLSNGRESFNAHNDSEIGTVKFYLMGTTTREAEDFIKKVEKALKDIAVSKAESYDGEGFTDVYVTNAEATKQHAVLKTAEILGISTKEIIGIGNDYNDFPLLMACGLKVAMGNAVDDLKAIADYIAPSVEHDGVVEVIEKFIFK
jgi:5-amino-6-(5-phospho-D-ribitylamino)uracil phosphatase